MSTLQNTILSDVLSENPLSERSLAFFRTRFKLALHQCVLREFKRQEREKNLTQAKLARRIGRKPEVISRILGGPGNWTLETVSDMLLGMNAEPNCDVLDMAEHQRKPDPVPAEVDKAFASLTKALTAAFLAGPVRRGLPWLRGPLIEPPFSLTATTGSTDSPESGRPTRATSISA